ncbi:hypothetical protein [Mycobacterium paraintracellulare]|uniref:hypothetical protein n=1 Tax=Mycobacterium paraintracellulare TaxID=1138383 RepID=UPI0019168FBC|nr:hypothetical protein [Mycobacterium paraintracellulare]
MTAFATSIVRDDDAGIADAPPRHRLDHPRLERGVGRATGIDDGTSLADMFAQYELPIKPQGFAFDRNSVGFTSPDTGEHNGKRLEQEVVDVLTVGSERFQR